MLVTHAVPPSRCRRALLHSKYILFRYEIQEGLVSHKYSDFLF